MKKVVYTAIAISAILSLSCTRKINTGKSMNVTRRNIEQTPMLVDLDIKNEKISGTFVGSLKKQSLTVLKENAIADALKKSNFDVMVEPLFEVSNILNQATVVVTGYPAKYVNFRKYTTQDSTIFHFDKLNKDIKTKTENSNPEPRFRFFGKKK